MNIYIDREREREKEREKREKDRERVYRILYTPFHISIIFLYFHILYEYTYIFRISYIIHI